MFGKTFKRTWVSPIVALSFAAVGISGVLMLFEVRSFPMKMLHEWIGVVLVVAGSVHLLLNWRVFLSYFQNRSAMAALAVTGLLCVALLFARGGEGPGHGEGPHHARPPMADSGDQ